MKKRARNALAPDITPLIDVVFLLLIFFMVSTVLKKEELALMLNLPQVEEGDSTSNTNSMTIELNAEKIAVNGKEVTIKSIGKLLDGITKKTDPIDLRIDKEVKYHRIVKILHMLKIRNLNNLSLITDS